MAFVGHYLSFPCALVHSCAFLGVPMCYGVFAMHPNQPLLQIIHQSRVVLCICYGLESAFIVDLLIKCILNYIASNQF